MAVSLRPKLLKATSLRKLAPAELDRLGLSRKSERYVSAKVKALTASTPTVSKRQYLKAQRGGRSNESHAKLLKSPTRIETPERFRDKQYPGATTSIHETFHELRRTRKGFDADLAAVQRKYAKEIARGSGMTASIMLRVPSNKRGEEADLQSNTNYLELVTWEKDVIRTIQEKKYAYDLRENARPTRIYIKIRRYIKGYVA